MSSVLTAKWKNASYHSGNLTKSTFLHAAPLPEMLLYTCSPQTAPFPLLFLLKCIYEPNLHVGGRVRGREVLHAYSDQFLRGNWPQEELAGEDLAAGLAEVFREESINDRVDARVPVG